MLSGSALLRVSILVVVAAVLAGSSRSCGRVRRHTEAPITGRPGDRSAGTQAAVPPA